MSARRFSADGASHRRPYHARMPSRAAGLGDANGSTLSGRNAALVSVYGTSCAEPQNGQFCAWRDGIEHGDRIAALAAHLPRRALAIRALRPESREAPRRGRARRSHHSRRCVPAIRCRRTGRRACLRAGFQTASPPHAGQANFGCAASRRLARRFRDERARVADSRLRTRRPPLSARATACRSSCP